ncbi:MAG: sulfate reduction electron transfer complex DsrMKJOP subunit DsrM [Deltaproteobacteria bacterium]|nr:sulfate reduction electron transfer complex DsrMKJOP subunit DsrM [Deltaproteobacteria bacterium]MDL1986903.1 sulfate reduction electron transfer complex DsrMKJOP subunit DsrM [Deltaproteobacteria bacterium]
MNEKYLYSLIAVVALFLVAYVGVEAAGLQWLFGIIIPYLAIITFIVGFVMRVNDWARSPVPFRIPSTCGQQKSLPWIKHSKVDNPFSTGGVIIRMILEILLFRSLFRNTKCNMNEGARISYVWEKWLWLFSLAFHYSFLVVLVRHLRFFLEPVPVCFQILDKVDGFLQIGLPGVMISGVVLLAAAMFLLLRRILISQVRYFSLAADFFPLFLIIGIAVSGIMMRYFTKVDIVGVKELTMGLVTFHPHVPEGIGSVFYVHVFFVSVLLAYFPFSKLMHLAGIFLSPTRNLPNNNRAYRHINPWNPKVKVHTYEEYEDDFREKMIEAGLPVDKEL